MYSCIILDRHELSRSRGDLGAEGEEGGGGVEDKRVADREDREDQQPVQEGGCDHQRVGERAGSEVILLDEEG